jgi:hypothetical protein
MGSRIIAVILHQQDDKRCWNEGSDYCGILPKSKRKEPYLVSFMDYDVSNTQIVLGYMVWKILVHQ